jgi:hypothetical protein
LFVGHKPAHEARWPALGKPTHIGPDLGQDSGGGDGPDTGDRLEQCQGVRARRQAPLDPSLQLDYGLLQKVRVGQDLPDQHHTLGLDASHPVSNVKTASSAGTSSRIRAPYWE